MEHDEVPFSPTKDPADFTKYQNDAEVFHSLREMLGVEGCLVPELLTKFGSVLFAEPLLFETEGAVFADDYLSNPELVHTKDTSLILLTTLLFVEPVGYWWLNGAMSAETKSAERTTYDPGGLFDHLNHWVSPGAGASNVGPWTSHG